MSFFIETITGPSLAVAFECAVHDARLDGHWGRERFNGTVADKDEVLLLAEAEPTNDAAWLRAMTLLDEEDARISHVNDPAGAVPVLSADGTVAEWIVIGVVL